MDCSTHCIRCLLSCKNVVSCCLFLVKRTSNHPPDAMIALSLKVKGEMNSSTLSGDRKKKQPKTKQLSYPTVHTVAVCFMSLLVLLVVSYMSKSDGANDKPVGKVQRLSGNYSINVFDNLE